MLTWMRQRGQKKFSPVHGADTTLDRLDFSTNPSLKKSMKKKHLEYLSTWVDDLSADHGKFQYDTRTLARGGDKRGDKRRGGKGEKKVSASEAWASNEASKRIERLLISSQISTYCDLVDNLPIVALESVLSWMAFRRNKNY